MTAFNVDHDLINHQHWLESAYELIRKTIPELSSAPDEIIVTYGFPYIATHRGECIIDPNKYITTIIIHPSVWTDSVEVLIVLIHEMIHAAVGVEKEEHGDLYIKTANKIGLLSSSHSPPIFDMVSIELHNKIADILDMLPDMPKGGLDLPPPPNMCSNAAKSEQKQEEEQDKNREEEQNDKIVAVLENLLMCQCGKTIQASENVIAQCQDCYTTFVPNRI